MIVKHTVKNNTQTGHHSWPEGKGRLSSGSMEKIDWRSSYSVSSYREIAKADFF